MKYLSIKLWWKLLLNNTIYRKKILKMRNTKINIPKDLLEKPFTPEECFKK